MRNILLIGAGNIGSRHLQGLATMTIPLAITVVDPSIESRKVAKERFEAVKRGADHQITFSESLREMRDQEIDLAIIATASAQRKAVFESLTEQMRVRAVLFEKILFDRPAHYEQVGNILREKNIHAWVNCPMRITPAYKDIKNIIGEGKLNYSVSGGNWGLMCNAIHFLDHFSSLTGCQHFQVETKYLNPTLLESKRKGYHELDGSLILQDERGGMLFLSHTTEGNAPIMVQLQSAEARILVRENEQKKWVADARRDWQWEERDAPSAYQSQLTGPVVEEILSKGTCALPSYHESANLHLQLFEPIRALLKLDYYPFT